MIKKEFTAWSLLVAASLLGSLMIVILSGCKPPAPTNVDVSTDTTTGEPVSKNVTGSNVTGSNVTGSLSLIHISEPTRPSP